MRLVADRMEAARSAQASWSALSPAQRVPILRALRHSITARIDEIVAVLSEETGKPPLDALGGDVMVTLEQLRYYERFAPRTLHSRSIGKPSILYTGTRFKEISQPHGVALIFAPWNYPFQLSVVPMATALFTGNAVLLKCSERTPRTADLITSLCLDAKLPANLVQVSCELPAVASALIESRPDFIFFTGASHNGRAVAQQAAAHLIPAALELGGKDACLVFASCNLQRAVEGAVYGSFSNAGQVCVGTKRIYVEQRIYHDFLSQFLSRVGDLRIGTNLDSDLGPVRFDSVRQLLASQVDDAVARGARLLTPPQQTSEQTSPIVLTSVPAEARILTEESFGPVVCVAPFANETEAICFANATPFALSASVFTGNSAQARRVAAQLTAGNCSINDTIRNIANPHAAFGGNHASGYGRYHGAAGLHTFSRIKTVMSARDARSSERHWFPFTAATFHQLRKLLLFRHAPGSIVKRLRNLLPQLLILLTFVAAVGRAESSSALLLDITLPANAHGSLAYLVFASRDGFPQSPDKAIRRDFVTVPIPAKTHQVIDIGPLAAGRYAVAVYLDSNGNRRLDKGFLGIPKEPVGASNNPTGHMGPPGFDECAFTHAAVTQTISITLVR